jgi:hypothetical protein
MFCTAGLRKKSWQRFNCSSGLLAYTPPVTNLHTPSQPLKSAAMGSKPLLACDTGFRHPSPNNPFQQPGRHAEALVWPVLKSSAVKPSQNLLQACAS